MAETLVEGRAEVDTGTAGLRAFVGDDRVGVLVIDRPHRRNALTLAMWAALPGLLDRLAARADLRVLLVTGSGGVFSAGADIAELTEVYADPARADAYHATNVAAEQALAGFPRPTVAVVRGVCVGGGCQLAVACDLRLAAADARLGVTPAKLGVVYPAVPTTRLARLLGPARAKHLLFTADLVTAERALVWGLVDEVHPAVQLSERARQLAGTIAARSALTVAAAKAVLNAAVAGGDPQAAAEPWERRSRLAPDVQEGLRAFVERRPPVF